MFKLSFLSQKDKSEHLVILGKEVWKSEKASCATRFVVQEFIYKILKNETRRTRTFSTFPYFFLLKLLLI